MQHQLTRFLRRKQVQDLTGLSSSMLYLLMARGQFPKPVRLSANRVGWIEGDIALWQAERIAAHRARAA